MSLLAPLFLFGLFALAVPWLLHRISTDDPQKQDFSSDMLLEPQQTISSTHKRLRYWKLLSLRSLAVALLALLFAEPVFNKIKSVGNQVTRHLLVVDTSLSQSHSKRWQRSRELGNNIISQLPAGDEIVVISAADTLVQSDNQDYSADTAYSRLASLTAGATRLEYNRVTRGLATTIKESPNPVEVHFISDMQNTAMPERFADLAIEGINKLHLYNSATVDDENVSLTGSINEFTDTQADIQVLVQNHSASEANRTIGIVADNQLLQSKEVSLKPDSRTLVPFDAVDTREADGQVTLTLSPADDLTIDDSFTIALPHGDRTEIGVVSGVRNTIASTYLTAALESDPRYLARAVNGDAISGNEAGALALVPDASVLTDRASTRLRDYLNNGGTALVFAGADPHSANMRGLLGISGNINNDAAPLQINLTDATHPVIGDAAKNWRALTVNRNLPVTTTSDATTILSTSDDKPLLLERSIGDGRMLLFSSALNPVWNNLAVDPVFVAFVIRAVEYLLGETAVSQYRSIGNSVSLAPGAQLLNASGESLRDIANIGKREMFTFTEPGVYTIKSVSGSRFLSVNPDPLESDLTTADSTAIERWQNLVGNTANVSGNSVTAAIEKSAQQGAWHWILLALITIVVLESLYSHRHLWVKRGA